MIIRFLGPFEGLVAKHMNVNLNRKVELKEVILYVAERAEGFVNYTEMETDAPIPAHVMFLKRGKVLRLNDQVYSAEREGVRRFP